MQVGLLVVHHIYRDYIHTSINSSRDQGRVKVNIEHMTDCGVYNDNNNLIYKHPVIPGPHPTEIRYEKSLYKHTSILSLFI